MDFEKVEENAHVQLKYSHKISRIVTDYLANTVLK